MSEAAEARLLFAYGTLRRAAPMHVLIESDVRWLGPAHTRGRLYDLGAFPGVTPSAAPDDVVHGELLELISDPAPLLERVDRYEGASFRRELVDVAGPDGREVRAWIYFYRGDVRGRARIASGDYLGA